MAENLPASSSPLALASDANVNDELGTSGVAFGEVIKSVGAAVSTTQSRLNKAGAAGATALAETMIDVIALQEKVYDDSGNLTNVRTHTRTLPLINFLDPVIYQWDHVRVQGHFVANEFVADSSVSVDTKTQSAGVSLSLGKIFSGGGGIGGNYNNTSTQTDATSSQTYDVSLGFVRMNSLLTPRQDVGVPKPNLALQGPSLGIIAGEIRDLGDTRTMSVLIRYHRNGVGIANKPISIESQGMAWSFADPAQTRTSAAGDPQGAGNLEILLSREFLDPDEDRSPRAFQLSARIGIIEATAALTF